MHTRVSVIIRRTDLMIAKTKDNRTIGSIQVHDDPWTAYLITIMIVQEMADGKVELDRTAFYMRKEEIKDELNASER